MVEANWERCSVAAAEKDYQTKAERRASLNCRLAATARHCPLSPSEAATSALRRSFNAP